MLPEIERLTEVQIEKPILDEEEKIDYQIEEEIDEEIAEVKDEEITPFSLSKKEIVDLDAQE